MVRLGILSTARIGYEHVIPAIQIARHARVSAIASRSKAQAKKIATHFDIPNYFGSYDELLASDEIDAVYIPLPTSQHADWTIRTIKAGKHVLCEKPIALKAADILKIIKARDKQNVVVSEAFMVTYHPQWLKVKQLIQKGAIGRLRHVDGAFTYHNVNPHNMRNQLDLGGGVIPDIGVYPTVTTRFVTEQEPIRLQAQIDYDPKFNTDCYASVRAEFDTFELSFYLSTQLANRQTMVFHGNKGYIELSSPFNSNLYEGDEVRLHNQKHTEARTFRFTGVNQYSLQIEAFCRAVMGKRTTVFSLENSLLNQKMIDAIYRSGKSKRWEKCNTAC